MNAPDWKDLERLWQSDPAVAAPALEIIDKQRRRRFWSALVLASEGVITIVGLSVGVWFMTSASTPNGLVVGGGTILFTLFAAAASLWARRLPPVAPEESVSAAFDAAVRRARVSVRWGFSTFWIVAASLVFYAVVAFTWAAGPDYPPAVARRFLIVFGVWMLWTALAQGVAIAYYLRRARELGRLEELARTLAADR